jgi:hypothetical protein
MPADSDHIVKLKDILSRSLFRGVPTEGTRRGHSYNAEDIRDIIRDHSRSAKGLSDPVVAEFVDSYRKDL